MFTVKATYRNETRKFAFPESVLFPTYEELYHQLYRVFPISHNYYLSKLIFSPDASKPGRILIGKEVHLAEDYASRVAPLRRQWPNPLLRFSIFDETPHKIPSVVSENMSLLDGPSFSVSEVTPKRPPPFAPWPNCTLPLNLHSFIPPPPLPMQLSGSFVAPPPPPPVRISPPPPPPIIFSTTPSKSLSPVNHGSAKSVTGGDASCCSITKGKVEIEALMASFKKDLDHILCATFGVDYAKGRSIALPKASGSAAPCDGTALSHTDKISTSSADSSTSASSRWCFVCRTNFTGIWYGCIKCHWHAVCPGCFSKSHSVHTLSFGPSHIVQQRSPLCSLVQSVPSRQPSVPSPVPAPAPPMQNVSEDTAPPVHRGVMCDSCNTTITGVRHKCLDCPGSGAMEKHGPFHEFFDIETPGHVYVHTIFGGDDRGNRSCINQQASPSPAVATCAPVAVISPREAPVRHSATCNLCDSAIVGERFKCTLIPAPPVSGSLSPPHYPQLLTCGYLRITPEQHPDHGFVRVSKPEDLMMRYSLTHHQAAHLAICNSCRQTIRGARYKCMHPSCPDFDLCGDCEALPIPIHPLNHSMLKMRTPDTVIPSLRKVEQIKPIDEPTNQMTPLPCGGCTRFGSPASLPPVSPATPPKSPGLISLIPVAVSLPVSPPQPPEVTIENKASVTPAVADFLGLLCSPGSRAAEVAPTSISEDPSHFLVDTADPHALLSSYSTSDVFHQLWPKVNQEMQALIAGNHAPSVKASAVEPAVSGGSPLAEDALLATPVTHPVPHMTECNSLSPVSGSKSLAVFHGGCRSPSPVSSSVPDTRLASQTPTGEQLEVELVDANTSLSSAFVADTTVPDGQIFPPGAEFIKSWHMINNGKVSWPNTTELHFVAGETFASERSACLKAEVGFVYPGEDLDIWTGDLKAPDVPGRYVGYWRLNDGRGNFFGSSLWIDLSVVDHHSSDRASEHPLAASSMVMPSPHPTNSVTVSEEPKAGLPVPPSPLSAKPATDEVEDRESDGSSVSLVSVPTSDDEDAEWQGTSSHSEPLEYVVLYDSNSEDE
ncbi:hypothetical protein PAXINDRAFT_6125 [Paxillus involutus ATCC 200175]|nr:hypothetical protein PAXINDRAFT_6125 [Paxillus involutus ATCC 200175]